MPLPRPQPDWMLVLRVGDVLKSATGSYRIVRSVSRKPDGRLFMVSFTIKHCSWTGRCYTYLTVHDLYNRGFQPVGARIKLTSALDTKIQQSITDKGNRPWPLRCCDVRGIA